jgi:phosphoribosylanthranilate isomerase
LVGKLGKPFFLAGGLGIENVGAAIAKVNPFAVDVSSGVETDGVKDAAKIETLVRRVRHGC